jgi:hypothetical protein
VYRIVIYPEASDQIAELPPHLLRDYDQALDAAAAAPWDGAPHHKDNPSAEVRRWLFGPLGTGQLLYLVLEREREIHVLQVLWLELPDE